MPAIPKMSLHAASGQARVRVPKRLRRPGTPQDLYLGPYGSQEAHRRYAAFLTDVPGERVPAEIASRAGSKVLVCELAAAYRQHLETKLDGRTEAAIRTARSNADVAIELLVEQHHAVRVHDFDAAMLEQSQSLTPTNRASNGHRFAPHICCQSGELERTTTRDCVGVSLK